jgi:hypothetical protein
MQMDDISRPFGIAILGLVVGWLFFPVYDKVYSRFTRNATGDLRTDWRSQGLVIAATALACITSGAVLAGPAYLFGLRGEQARLLLLFWVLGLALFRLRTLYHWYKDKRGENDRESERQKLLNESMRLEIEERLREQSGRDNGA